MRNARGWRSGSRRGWAVASDPCSTRRAASPVRHLECRRRVDLLSLDLSGEEPYGDAPIDRPHPPTHPRCTQTGRDPPPPGRTHPRPPPPRPTRHRMEPATPPTVPTHPTRPRPAVGHRLPPRPPTRPTRPTTPATGVRQPHRPARATVTYHLPGHPPHPRATVAPRVAQPHPPLRLRHTATTTPAKPSPTPWPSKYAKAEHGAPDAGTTRSTPATGPYDDTAPPHHHYSTPSTPSSTGTPNDGGPTNRSPTTPVPEVSGSSAAG